MFVRLKTPEGDNVTLVAASIDGMIEAQVAVDDKGQPVSQEAASLAAMFGVEQGAANDEAPAAEPTKKKFTYVNCGRSQYMVVETERLIRSKMLKAFSNPDAADD